MVYGSEGIGLGIKASGPKASYEAWAWAGIGVWSMKTSVIYCGGVVWTVAAATSLISITSASLCRRRPKRILKITSDLQHRQHHNTGLTLTLHFRAWGSHESGAAAVLQEYNVCCSDSYGDDCECSLKPQGRNRNAELPISLTAVSGGLTSNVASTLQKNRLSRFGLLCCCQRFFLCTVAWAVAQ